MTKFISQISLCTLLSTVLFMSSCERHEVIPAPDPVIEYDCSFSAIVSDTINVLYSEGVDGYNCVSDVSKLINSGAGDNEAICSDEIYSDDNNFSGAAELKHGSILWGSDENVPPRDVFEQFFDASTVPFSYEGSSGVEIIWYDSSGTDWFSVDTADMNQFEYTSIDFKEDSMEYALFEAKFQCKIAKFVKNSGGDIIDTTYRELKDGIFKGRYTRK